MAIDTAVLQRLLCERLCEEVHIAKRPDGAMMLRTHFEFPDGDRLPIHVSELGAGGLRLSDQGHTLMHISYDHDVDSFLKGTRGQLIERTMAETGLEWDGGAFCVDTPIDRLPEAIFRFGQAVNQGLRPDLSCPVARAVLLSTTTSQIFFQVWWTRIKSNAITYRKQCRIPRPTLWTTGIESKPDTPLFLYGVPNRDKARPDNDHAIPLSPTRA